MDFNEIGKSFRTAYGMYGRAPWAAAAAGAAALIAPWMLKNDDRGYLGTAAFTTPLIGAAFAATPHLWKTGRKLAGDVSSARGAFTFSLSSHPVNVRPFEQIQALRSNRAFRSVYNKAASRYYSSGIRANAAFNTTDAFTEAMDLLKPERDSGAFSQLTQNAITEAVGAGISPDDMLTGKALDASALPASFEDAERILNEYSGNEGFLKRFLYRIKSNTRIKANRPVAGGIQALPDHHIENVALEDALDDIEAALGKGGRGSRVAGNLRDAMGRFRDGRAWYEVLPGEKKRLLGATMTNRQFRDQRIQLPMLQDPDNQLWRMGADWNKSGVVQNIYNRTGSGVTIHDHLEYISSHLKDHDWEKTLTTHNSTAFFGGRSPDEAWKIDNLPDMSDMVMPKDQALQHAATVKPTDHAEFGGKTYQDLDYNELKAVNADMVSLNRMSTSESKVTAGAFLDRAASVIQEGGVVEHSSNPAAIIAAKPIYFSPETVAEHTLPPTSAESIGREIYLKQANVAPQFSEIFGLLPTSGTSIPEHIEKRMEQHMIRHIQQGGSATEDEAIRGRKIFQKLKAQYLSNPNRWASLRELAYPGEGSSLSGPSLGTAKLNMVYSQRVDVLHEGISPGAEIDGMTTIGMHKFEPVVGKAGKNTVISVNRSGDFSDVLLRGEFNFSGAKLQRDSVKGMNNQSWDSPEEWAHKQEVLSAFNMETGHAGAVEGADLFVAEQYAKEKSPGIVALHQGADIANQIRNEVPWVDGDTEMWRDKAVGERNATLLDLQNKARSFESDVLANGYIRSASGQLIDSAGVLSPLEAAERQQNLARISTEFLDQVGPRIQALQPQSKNALLHGYARTVNTMGKDRAPSLAHYLHHTITGVSTSATNSSQFGLPKHVKITRDLLLQMEAQGDHEGIRSLYAHLTPNGDRVESGKYFEHLAAGDFNRPLGTVIPASEVRSAELGTIESRIRGSMFSAETHPANFSIDLGKDLGFGRYVPVLGRKADKGGVNKYGPGDFSSTPNERAMNSFYKSIEGVDTANLGDDDPIAKNIRKAWADTNMALQDDLFGKKGLLSDIGTHDNAVSGDWITRPAEFDPKTGDLNPFLVSISEDRVDAIGDRATREALRMEGGFAYGIMSRDPNKNPAYVKIRMDKTLDHGYIGAPQILRTSFGADDDGDFGKLYIDRANADFRKAAEAAIHDPLSLQHRQLNSLAGMQGHMEAGVNYSGEMVRNTRKSRTDLAAEYVVKNGIDEHGISGMQRIMDARLAVKSTGRYGNMHELLQVSMNRNAALLADPLGHLELNNLLFHATKQYTIAAGKNKAGVIADPLEHYNNMKAALATGNDERMQQTISQMVGDFKVKSILTEESIAHFGLDPELYKPGAVENVYQLFADSKRGRGLIQTMVKGHTVNAEDQARLLSGIPSASNRARMLRGAQGLGSDMPAITASIHEAGYGANMGSDALGALNQFVRNAGGEANEALHASGGFKIAAAGLGIAAVAGFLSTRVSSNQHRPEERAGVSDRIPGEPVAGSRASVNPVRRQMPAPAQARTAVVASLRNKVDLEVRARAGDRESGAEMEKLIRRSAGNQGTTNVTVNRVGGWRNSSSKLRMRQQIRQSIDSQPEG